MKIKELYNDLIKAFSNENLNLITGKLIMLYKNKNYSKIREIANKISKFIAIDEEKDAKCFSKLIMLYHPDKGGQFRTEIEKQYRQNDYEKLNQFSHIFLIEDIDNVVVSEISEDIDYNPEYTWDIDNNDGFDIDNTDLENEVDSEYETVDFEKSFYNLIKIREYGKIDVEFPSYYLEDFEEFEMAYSGLETLDGVEHCVHVKILDVSNNSISDLGNLWNLENLEELYIANNEIGIIDTLSNLTRLKIVDLSSNQIDDVSSLLELGNLEYVNLMGNPVPKLQIDLLEKNGIIVMTDKVRTQNNVYNS
jgi:Leucine-rich repeat (LRR) protein